MMAAAVAVLTMGCGRTHNAQAPVVVEVVQTSADLSQRLTRLPDIRFQTSQVRQGTVIHVDSTAHYQRVLGFGAAMTDTSAWLLYTQLSPPARATVMRNLFGASGIHLNFVRVPIGASDFTATGVPYSYDDLPASHSDPDLSRFSIDHDRAYVLPVLRQMLLINPEAKILASLWSPPGWMKSNDALNNLRQRGTLLPSAYGPLANYFVKFIRAYRGNGVSIDAVTPQNEPGLPSRFPGTNLPQPSEARFIADYLSPALRSAGLGTKIYAFDFNWFYSSYARRIASSARVVRDIVGIAWHCYRGNPNAMSALHRQVRHLEQLETECSTGIAPGPPAELVIASLRNWASTVLLWNLALDPSGGPVQPPNGGCRHCTGVVTVNSQANAVTYRPDYYQLGQASSFVQPGARRIGSEHFVHYRDTLVNKRGSYATPGLDDVGFANPDGSKVLLAYNNASRSIRFAVVWQRRSFSYELPPHATVTFIWH